MNTCRWCGGRSQSVAFCSAECAAAANEMPELIHRSSDPLPVPSPRHVAAPKRSWFLGVLSGGLMGLGLAMALSPQAATPKAACGPRDGMGKAKVEVRAATLDFVQNGLAGVWDGRIDEPGDLTHWFVPGDATAAPMARIFQDQIKRAGTHLTDAEVVDIRVSNTLDHADADFFVQTDEARRGHRCYTGTFQWIHQQDGSWLRSKVSILKETACR